VELTSRDDTEPQSSIDSYTQGHFILKANDYVGGRGRDTARCLAFY